MNGSYLNILKKVSLKKVSSRQRLCGRLMLMVSGFLAVTVGLTGCAYRLGSPDRSLPGGYRQVFVPMFKNKTYEPSVEVAFTNSLIMEFERSKIGRVTDSHQAEVLVEGEIESIAYNASPPSTGSSLPTGAVLSPQYQILISARVTLRRNSDKSVLWSGTFKGERNYNAPFVTGAGINTVNPLYNLAARRQNIEAAAAEMMSEAHDRMTENF
jgi:hypothetical protein